jgi:hypothetical protein
MNKIFKHSGTLGDLIYSLYMVKKMGGGYFDVAIENIENCVEKYGYRPEHIDPQHKGRFTVKDFEMMLPLLRKQSYIETVRQWHQGDPEPDVDLDEFRRVLYRSFEGNILQAYHLAFDMPFTMQDYDTPWLEADVITEAPVVITRSMRYRPPNGEDGWKNIIDTGMIEGNSVFVGIATEHEDFEKTFGIKVPFRPVNDFLELASIINGADLFVGNQGFAYSMAIGLGKSTVLEINKLVPMQHSECFFPRTNCQYF